MGTSASCDNGENVKIDWDEDNSSPYTCPLDKTKKTLPIPELPNAKYPCPYMNIEMVLKAKTSVLETNLPETDRHHICVNSPISYNSPYPSIGRHRPAWPQYGTYLYLPPQRWLHNLEHGGIVALYHPCVPENKKTEFLRALACAVKDKTPSNGTPMFVATPEEKIPACQPFVLVAWKNRLLMTDVLPNKIRAFVKMFYRKGPEANFRDGQYSTVKKVSSKVFVNKLHCH